METEIFVVETDDDILIGMIEFVKGAVIVRNGFVGRPMRVLSRDIVRVLPAEDHPLVYVLAG